MLNLGAVCVQAWSLILRVVIEREQLGVSNLSLLFSVTANGFYYRGLGQAKTGNI